jgi:type I site-specific restriction endonuclease
MNLPKLNFPEITFRFKTSENAKQQIFDIVRKKFVELTPEEWVRQHLIDYLINHKLVPISLISVEKQLILNGTKRRTDIVIYNSTLQPIVIIECKAPNIQLSQATFNQAFGYNMVLNVPILLLSNGLSHVCVNYINNEPIILSEIPAFDKMQNNF